jgi:hypothetical protein
MHTVKLAIEVYDTRYGSASYIYLLCQTQKLTKKIDLTLVPHALNIHTGTNVLAQEEISRNLTLWPLGHQINVLSCLIAWKKRL